MTTIACERCGTSFDTDRDGVTPAQDTMRCPSCGASAALPDGDGDGDGAGDASAEAGDDAAGETVATVDTDGGTVVVELHVHVHR
jgi:predicted Zn finger-like uncharacterized protein